MFNKVILVGNLTRDVELKYTNNGLLVAKTGIATNRKYKNATGEQKDEIMFIDLTFFGRTAEFYKQYLRKGNKILVEGRLILEQWVAKDGTNRSKHSITVENFKIISARISDYGVAADSQQKQQQINNENSSITPEIEIDEDEIPF